MEIFKRKLTYVILLILKYLLCLLCLKKICKKNKFIMLFCLNNDKINLLCLKKRKLKNES